MKFIPKSTMHMLYGRMISKVFTNGDGVEVVNKHGDQIFLDKQAVDRIHKATYYESDGISHNKPQSNWRDRKKEKVPVWYTADHRAIPITEMTDRHIRNALNKMQDPEYPKHRKYWEPILRAELYRRG